MTFDSSQPPAEAEAASLVSILPLFVYYALVVDAPKVVGSGPCGATRGVTLVSPAATSLFCSVYDSGWFVAGVKAGALRCSLMCSAAAGWYVTLSLMALSPLPSTPAVLPRAVRYTPFVPTRNRLGAARACAGSRPHRHAFNQCFRRFDSNQGPNEAGEKERHAAAGGIRGGRGSWGHHPDPGKGAGVCLSGRDFVVWVLSFSHQHILRRASRPSLTLVSRLPQGHFISTAAVQPHLLPRLRSFPWSADVVYLCCVHFADDNYLLFCFCSPTPP